MNAKPTPGPWELVHKSAVAKDPSVHADGAEFVVAEARGAGTPEETDFANAALIVAAVNACFKISPENPIAAAEALPELVESVAEGLHALEQHGNDFHPVIQSHLRTVLAKLVTP